MKECDTFPLEIYKIRAMWMGRVGNESMEGSSRAQPSLTLRANMKATGKLVGGRWGVSDYSLYSSELF